MFFNSFVKQGLCETGLVSLIVPVFPVTQNIDKHIGMKLLPEIHCQLNCINQGFHIVAVHVEYRRTGYFGHIGTVCTRAGIEIISGKSHLVIDDQVDSSPCFVTIELRHLNHFVYHTLRSNGSVAVDHNRSNFVKIAMMGRINP